MSVHQFALKLLETENAPKVVNSTKGILIAVELAQISVFRQPEKGNVSQNVKNIEVM